MQSHADNCGDYLRRKEGVKTAKDSEIKFEDISEMVDRGCYGDGKAVRHNTVLCVLISLSSSAVR